MKKIVSLSHCDLDGYGAQLVISKTRRAVAFFNTNYGAEILEKASLAIEEMNGCYEDHVLLITDVNLTMEQAEYLDNLSKELGFELLLIDHHATGKSVAEKYDWYNLDTNFCATKLVFEHFKEELTSRYSMDVFSSIVNAYDLWKEDLPEFLKGKLLNELVFEGYKFPKETLSLKNASILYNLEEMNKLLTTVNVSDGEGMIKLIREKFLKGKIPNKILLDNMKTVNDKYHYLVFNEFKKFNLPVVMLDGIRCKVFFNIDGGVFQNISSLFNKEQDGFDACINISAGGVIGLRSKGTEDRHNVSALAVKFFNGGGHFNASGGSLILDKKSITKEEAIEMLLQMGGELQ